MCVCVTHLATAYSPLPTPKVAQTSVVLQLALPGLRLARVLRPPRAAVTSAWSAHFIE